MPVKKIVLYPVQKQPEEDNVGIFDWVWRYWDKDKSLWVESKQRSPTKTQCIVNANEELGPGLIPSETPDFTTYCYEFDGKIREFAVDARLSKDVNADVYHLIGRDIGCRENVLVYLNGREIPSRNYDPGKDNKAEKEEILKLRGLRGDGWEGSYPEKPAIEYKFYRIL